MFCFRARYELETKSSLVTHALLAKSCTRDTDGLHSCTRLMPHARMACLYHSCKIWPREHSYPNLIPMWKGLSLVWKMWWPWGRALTPHMESCGFAFHSQSIHLPCDFCSCKGHEWQMPAQPISQLGQDMTTIFGTEYFHNLQTDILHTIVQTCRRNLRLIPPSKGYE